MEVVQLQSDWVCAVQAALQDMEGLFSLHEGDVVQAWIRDRWLDVGQIQANGLEWMARSKWFDAGWMQYVVLNWARANFGQWKLCCWDLRAANDKAQYQWTCWINSVKAESTNDVEGK
ncbi:hypothetical protein HPP92_025760 [Vanilla planifolia]|uniref:Uncharacterized protein n=1 Tax=Vanilla planifolia TaxID=51239 RepID=A0A835PLL6_VANPL|nr:hypothetical protein HPP92_025760 [Vanilla planifolia]